jgi:c-di-GMP-binding flagellar brake protein YcgR
MTGPVAVPFRTGQIVVVGAGPAQSRRWYRTTVQRIDSRIVWVDGAPEGGPTVPVQPGQTVTCHTWRHMDALYQADATVAFTRLAPDPLVGLTIVRAERIQQREYVRVPLSTVATGLYLGSPADPEHLPAQELHLDVHDLSASGLRGKSDLPLLPGDEIALDLELPRTDPNRSQNHHRQAGRNVAVPVHLRGRVVALPDLPEPLNLRARVVRLIETGRPLDLTREIGVVFVDLTRATQERIIRFALDVQRDRRRRGMM